MHINIIRIGMECNVRTTCFIRNTAQFDHMITVQNWSYVRSSCESFKFHRICLESIREHIGCNVPETRYVQKATRINASPQNVGRRSENLEGGCKAQRENYNNNELSADQIKRLESIGFAWDVHEEWWTEMYNRLVMYKKQHKSTQVPSAYTDENNGSHLGAWGARQRTKYNKDKLLKERMELL